MPKSYSYEEYQKDQQTKRMKEAFEKYQEEQEKKRRYKQATTAVKR
jgi:hypothetical protein